MEIEKIYQKARKAMAGTCVICKVCDGRHCAGQVPGMGGKGSGGSFQEAYKALKKRKLVLSALHQAKDPKMEIELFGKKLSAPILGAPITGPSINFGGAISQEDFCKDLLLGFQEEGSLAMIGDTGDPTAYEGGLAALRAAKGEGIAIIKPRAQEEIIKRIRQAEEAGALAVGIDIDGAGLVTMKLFGQEVGPKSREELKELVEATSLPFIVKGIMTVEDAAACVEAGVSAIVVSNHGGRVLDDCQAPADVIEDISKAFASKLDVLVDGSVRSGSDVLKYLALGAKAVLVGRPCIWAVLGGRKEGVKVLFSKLKSELYQSMILTGSASASQIKRRILSQNE